MQGVEYYIGTSGYSYPHWKNGVFYPQGVKNNQMLEYYSQFFNTVELNVTFYRIPSAKVFYSWYKRTPENFKFVVKGTRIITHLKKLRDCQEILRNFIEVVSNLKEKVSLILWQLSPAFKSQESQLSDFLKELSRSGAKNYLHVFEFRHPSWFNSNIYNLLKRYKVCLCIADSPRWPVVEEVTANFLYLRFHGGRMLYGSEYSQEELNKWSEKVKELIRKYKIRKVFAYFNNDTSGFAVKNALTFRDLLVE